LDCIERSLVKESEPDSFFASIVQLQFSGNYHQETRNHNPR